MSDIRNNRRPKNNRRVNGVQRKNTMEAVNSASSVVRTSGTDAAKDNNGWLGFNRGLQAKIRKTSDN